MKFLLDEKDVKDILSGKGYCIASNEITVNGKKVGYMLREKPSVSDDSGWVFFAGDEDEEYCNNPDNFAIFDVNTICNYDNDVIRFIDCPYGTEVELNDNGKLEIIACSKK